MRKFVSFLCVLILLHCSSAPAYLSDRGMDARDMVDASFQTASIGFALEIGPYLISPVYIDYYGIGLSGGELGYTGKTTMNFVFIMSNMNSETGSTNLKTVARLDYRKKEFNTDTGIVSMFHGDVERLKPKKNSYGRLGIRVGAVAGVRFAINFFEVADFVTGVFGYDLLNDDYFKYIKEQEAGQYAAKK